MKLFTLYGELELATINFNQGVAAAKEQMQGLKTDMGGIQTEAEKTGGVLDTAFGHALGDFIGEFAGTLTDVAFDIMSDGTVLAASMENLGKTLAITFGDSSGQITQWAKTAKSSFGLGQVSAIQYADSLGNMLKQTGATGDELASMSMNLAGLAGDLAIFKNANSADAVNAMVSALHGETESIEKFSIFINDTAMATYAMNKGLIDTAGGWAKLDEGTKRWPAILQSSIRQGMCRAISQIMRNPIQHSSRRWTPISSS